MRKPKAADIVPTIPIITVVPILADWLGKLMLGCVVKANQVDSGGFDADSDDVDRSSFEDD